MESKKEKKNWLLWLTVVVISAIIIYLGNKIATRDIKLFVLGDDDTLKISVTKVLGSSGGGSDAQEGVSQGQYSVETVKFTGTIETGDRKGETIVASQMINQLYAGHDSIKKVEVGDNVLVTEPKVAGNPATSGAPQGWIFLSYYLFDKVMIMAGIFALLLIILGGLKGVNTIISLGFTFSFVFMVLVPWVIGGGDIYIGVAATCVFTVVMSLLLIGGNAKKSFVTMAGCFGGITIAAILTYSMNHVMHITGFIDEQAIYLSNINPNSPIDLVALVFAGIVIGAMGAIMDVAMDISSSLNEIVDHAPEVSFKKLIKSGMTIGSDVMGTMANTLVLAYIGGSFGSIILLVTYSTSITHLLNREIILVELMQAIIGSIGLLLTAPLTVIIGATVYLKRHRSLQTQED